MPVTEVDDVAWTPKGGLSSCSSASATRRSCVADPHGRQTGRPMVIAGYRSSSDSSTDVRLGDTPRSRPARVAAAAPIASRARPASSCIQVIVLFTSFRSNAASSAPAPTSDPAVSRAGARSLRRMGLTEYELLQACMATTKPCHHASYVVGENEGLVPRGQRTDTGSGGSLYSYEDWVVGHVCAVAQALRRKRNVDAVAVSLWWEAGVLLASASDADQTIERASCTPCCCWRSARAPHGRSSTTTKRRWRICSNAPRGLSVRVTPSLRPDRHGQLRSPASSRCGLHQPDGSERPDRSCIGTPTSTEPATTRGA